MSTAVIHYPTDFGIMDLPDPAPAFFIKRSKNMGIGNVTASSIINQCIIKINSRTEDKTKEKSLNLGKLVSFHSLEPGWNGPGSIRPSDEVINKAKVLVELLKFQPEIFPTGRNSIQLEYEQGHKYFEIEVLEKSISCFYSESDGTELEWTLNGTDADVIVAVADRMYAA